MRRKRLAFLGTFLFLFAVETGIALFVRDSIVRPYIGDVLVILLLYCLVRSFFPVGIPLLPVCVFAFAAFIEILQYFQMGDLPAVRAHPVLRVMLGSVFDPADLICYALGTAVLFGFEWLRLAPERKQKKKKKGA